MKESDVPQAPATLLATDREHASILYQQEMERVVVALRDARDHSGAFLQRVTDREAPDYSLYIHEPMDLGTLLKNVRGGKYRPLGAFEYDLRLIFSNARTYNELESCICDDAAALECIADILLASFPDIVVLPGDLDAW